MSEKPILFSGEMVKAILEGRKGQTRRIVNPQPHNSANAINHCTKRPGYWWQGIATEPKSSGCITDYVITSSIEGAPLIKCPYGQPGDRLWVKETFAVWCKSDLQRKDPDSVVYKVESKLQPLTGQIWRPSIFMPRWASRIALEITSVRAERLQDISEEDAKAEGVTIKTDAGIASEFVGKTVGPAQFEYYHLWESINGKGSWDANPWVWCISFKPINPTNKG